jgi:tetratricopeptide (TPR) repeat protein
MRLPSGWHVPSQALWEKAQTDAAIQSCVGVVNDFARQQCPSARLYDQLSYYLFVKGHFADALRMLEESHRLDPDNLETLRHLSVINKRLHKNAKAISWAQKALALAPDDFVSLDTLAGGLRHLNRFDEARAAGTRSLVLKEKAALRATPARPDWNLRAPRPSAGQHQIGALPNVIAFSLWGDQPRYLRGALRNALEAPQVMPGWTLRFDVDHTVPTAFLDLLRKNGAQVVVHQAQQAASLRQRLAWRFLVANDARVGYFLCRDADSVIGAREAQAVNAWLDGDAHFHVLRDWWSHTDLMLAGLWGGVAGVLPSIEVMMRDYQSPAMETANIDQWFLRDQVWPLIRHSVCVHDRLFTMPGARPVPGTSPPFGSNEHIGQNEHAVRAKAQAQALKPWLDLHPWL